MNKICKSAISIFLSVLIAFVSIAYSLKTSQIPAEAAGASYIDNSSLRTPWQPDSERVLDENGWPTYIKDLVIAEVRVPTCSQDGTFDGMEPMLKHLAEMGVNGLWINPLNDMGEDQYKVAYTNYGPHTIDPYVTGQIPYGDPWHEVDYDEGRKIVKKFIDKCHKYGFYVYVDFVTWGLSEKAPIFKEHPEWVGPSSSWGGLEWVHENAEVVEFYQEAMYEFIIETGVDGIRWDLEPADHFSVDVGYEFFSDMRKELNNRGYKTTFWTEGTNFPSDAFAFSQFGNRGEGGNDSQFARDTFFDDIDIVEAIRTGNMIGHDLLIKTQESGQGRYYSYQVSCHDFIDYANGTLADWAYQYLYGSFIPIFEVGEEWLHDTGEVASIFGLTDVKDFENFLKDPVKREYYENVKELIAYKWLYKDIVNKSTENHRETNICTVKVDNTNITQGYARFHDNKAFIVVPNVNEGSTDAVKMTFALPFNHMELDGYPSYTVTDIRTGKVMAKGDAKAVSLITDTIEHETCGLYLLTAEGTRVVPEKEDTATDEPVDEPAEEQEDNDSYDRLDTDDEIKEDDQSQESTKKPVRVPVERLEYVGLDTWVIALIIAGGVLLLGGVVAVIIIARKRKNK